MRSLGMVGLLALAACAAAGGGREGAGTAHGDTDSRQSASSMTRAPTTSAAQEAFSGAWQACAGTSSPEECSRYLLVQRGDRICGTWSYVASGQAYEGRVVARATSATHARRTHVCGRPGSDTETECVDGWQRIDRPLLLCDGRLGEIVGADGACIADYRPAPALQGALATLQAAPWVRACLSNNP
jgi:hypothetical protein